MGKELTIDVSGAQLWTTVNGTGPMYHDGVEGLEELRHRIN